MQLFQTFDESAARNRQGVANLCAIRHRRPGAAQEQRRKWPARVVPKTNAILELDAPLFGERASPARTVSWSAPSSSRGSAAYRSSNLGGQIETSPVFHREPILKRGV